jgi:hypothetical protein
MRCHETKRTLPADYRDRRRVFERQPSVWADVVGRQNTGRDVMAEADRPVAELLREFSEQTTALVRQELELARLEMTEKGKRAGLGIGMFGGAGAVGVYALGALAASAILLIATAVAAWLAAVIVAAALAVVAGVLAVTGRSELRRAVPPAPEQATESVKEDVQWTKNRVRQARN